MSFFYVVDDIRHVPSEGYAPIPLSHEQAREELRGKSWFWYIEDEKGESYRHLEDLTRRSQVTLDFGIAEFLEQRKVKDSQRLRVGTGHKFLLIRSDQSHKLFAFVAEKRTGKKKPRADGVADRTGVSDVMSGSA